MPAPEPGPHEALVEVACGQGEYCRTGRETLCPEQRNGGYSVDGSFGGERRAG